jgi:hypothetical protein
MIPATKITSPITIRRRCMSISATVLTAYFDLPGPPAEGVVASRSTCGNVMPGGSMAWAAVRQGSHATCITCVQNANGLALSTKRPNASKEGTACRFIDICSASPPRDRLWTFDIEAGQARGCPGGIDFGLLNGAGV